MWDGSTIDAESAQQISKQIKAAGAQYLEAPVSGTHHAAWTSWTGCIFQLKGRNSRTGALEQVDNLDAAGTGAPVMLALFNSLQLRTPKQHQASSSLHSPCSPQAAQSCHRPKSRHIWRIEVDGSSEFLGAGTKQPAEKGQLIFLNGGDKELFDRFAPCLDVMGKAKFYLGAVRTGTQITQCLKMNALIRSGTGQSPAWFLRASGQQLQGVACRPQSPDPVHLCLALEQGPCWRAQRTAQLPPVLIPEKLWQHDCLAFRHVHPLLWLQVGYGAKMKLLFCVVMGTMISAQELGSNRYSVWAWPKMSLTCLPQSGRSHQSKLHDQSGNTLNRQAGISESLSGCRWARGPRWSCCSTWSWAPWWRPCPKPSRLRQPATSRQRTWWRLWASELLPPPCLPSRCAACESVDVWWLHDA